MAAAQMVRGVPLSTLCPKFLHTNSTSHTGPFSAIAELIDNAYDPDVNAKQIWIDKTQIKDMECLTFMDNGNGLSSDMMHMMLSFGYSDKKAVNGKHPIGMYGNGFKSGSMRLGQDAIVLSISKNDLCVGMLSQTYLKKIGAKQITVPIISIKKPEAKHFSVMEEHLASLRDILDHSPFNTEEELLTELRAIESSCSSTGTRIIIWNLRRTTAGNMEFDFTTDRYDIRVPSDVLESTTESNQRPGRQDYSVPESEYSLREYCSVLYMKPRMQIIIRGQKVRTQFISKSLAHIARENYKPFYVKQKIPITFGYNTKNKEHYGLMMYHKNRLIKAYHRVGCQLNASNKQGIGVIGVIECNFLEPTHNKQDFDNTDKYRNAIRNVAIKLEEYCKEIRFKRKNSNRSNNVPIEEEQKRPDQNWAQCDKCQQWRRMPDGINNDKLPEEWFCSMNPDPQFRRCETMEEPEDSDSEQQTNPKTYKIQEKEEKKKQEELKEFKKFQEEKRQRELLLKAESLRRLKEEREWRKMTSTPNTPRTPGKGASASSLSTSSSQPVITEVFSLSKTPSRLQPTTPQNESKRQKLDGLKRKLVTDMSPSSSTTPPTPVPCKDLNIDDNLLEGSSTPAPTEPTLHPVGVRTESDPKVPVYGMAFSHAALEARSTGNYATEMRDKCTQMQGPRVKDEEEMYSSTAANDGAKVMEEGMISIIQAQEEQDQLMELLQSVSNERDSFKEKVGELHAQLELEKQCADCQTAREKAEKLSREKEALLETHSRHNQEHAKHFEDLTCRLERSSNEIEKLLLKVKQLEEEKATISAECEKNKSSLTKLKDKMADLLN
ncbi:MORC family CW-type zinc finger protein 3 isoform X1 [Gadus morhua]|uniref:MORC family CW-type zinc finger protein 3 isoform X1 n=3 Tax=Gadus morhua TaxID=8049 RepID=UPI0011B7ED1C|nr:MORC family CW-type zinc finger protein 3-like isoform X1 [Gadus morhua]XP_030199236.1 MORC family CW-type zinc finger protein 3-like isoform X1 [Gadus morhua]